MAEPVAPMAEPVFRLSVLGTRGSTATFGEEYAEFGGSTSCYLVEAGDETVILDAGTGIAHAPAATPKPPAILLSHWHLDHVSGLPTYGRLMQQGTTTRLYVPTSSDEDGLRTLDDIFAPPYWPLRIAGYPGDVTVQAMPARLHLGELLVETMAGSHPGGCLVYRLTYGSRTIVYATDFEHEADSFGRLISFCDGADLVLYDAQYVQDEYGARQGFGHSTTEKAVELKNASGAKRLLCIHHDPASTDDTLRRREQAIGLSDVRLAREGEVIEL